MADEFLADGRGRATAEIQPLAGQRDEDTRSLFKHLKRHRREVISTWLDVSDLDASASVGGRQILPRMLHYPACILSEL